MRVRCWFHTTYVSEDGVDWRPGEEVAHDFTPEETARLLEWFSHGDWEDGPRCLQNVLDKDQGEELHPILWVANSFRGYSGGGGGGGGC